jgi:hypothetical protein
MLIGDFAELYIYVFEVLAVVGVGSKYRYCDLDEVDVGADWVFLVGRDQTTVKVLNKLRKLELQTPHNYLNQFYNSLHLRVFVVLQLPRSRQYKFNILPYALSETFYDVQVELNEGSLAEFL